MYLIFCMVFNFGILEFPATLAATAEKYATWKFEDNHSEKLAA
jgi:hypothetical protein